MQLSYSKDPSRGYPGAYVDTGYKDTVSATVDPNSGTTSATAGIYPATVVCSLAEGFGQSPEAQAAAVDNLILSKASSASPISLANPSDFDGSLAAVAASPMAVASQVQLVLSSNADWDTSTATISGVNAAGQPVSEVLDIPDTGGVTLTTSNYFASVTGIDIDAQSGVNGTWTLGFASGVALSAGSVEGVAMWDPTKEAPSLHAPGQVVPVARTARVWVCSETAVTKGAAVYCRVRNPSANWPLGSLRTDSASGDAVLVPGMRFIGSAAAGAVVKLQVDAGR